MNALSAYKQQAKWYLSTRSLLYTLIVITLIVIIIILVYLPNSCTRYQTKHENNNKTSYNTQINTNTSRFYLTEHQTYILVPYKPSSVATMLQQIYVLISLNEQKPNMSAFHINKLSRTLQ